MNNMNIDNLLLWEKWRPRKMDDIVLLPRIRKHFENGIDGNYIFYGNYGTGKTSLARILIGKYTKDKPFLELNSSFYTSIDVLRNEIEDFCKFTPMMSVDSDYKYIFLDEFERTSTQFQDAFKAFIEKYNKSVRFIISTNHINKIGDGIKSRIPQINFNCQNIEEEKYIKKETFKRIKNVILTEEDKEIGKEDLAKIITKNFPDLRSILVNVENFLKVGSTENGDIKISNKLKEDLYNFIYEPNLDYDKIYHYLMDNFTSDNIDVMIKILGSPFVEWSIKNNKNIDKLFECNYVISDYGSKLENSTDPLILGMTIVGKFRDILL
jgi:DNA polymerase III delta prime subunit